jgi:hypothetical protein
MPVPSQDHYGGEESQVPGDLRQSEILIEQDFKI